MQPGSGSVADETTSMLPSRSADELDATGVNVPLLGLDRDAGAYMSVLTASFGGIRVHRAEGEGPRLHPFLLVVLCLPLFVVQLSTILALRLDLDLESCVREPRGDDACIDYSHWDSDPAGAELTAQLKLVMVLVLQLTQFNEMMTTARAAVFVMNPVTWLELKHPTTKQWTSNTMLLWRCPLAQYLFRPILMAPMPLGTLAIRFFIGYYVCVDSMSLILASTSVKDAIFNSLAMTFIVELSRIYMGAATDVFHFQIEDEVIKIDPNCWISTDSFDFTAEKKETLLFPDFLAWLVKKFKFLRRSHGAKDTEQFVASSIVGILYFRQLVVLIHAYETNVIPVARDICTTYRWNHGGARVFKKTSRFVSWALNHIVLIDAAGVTEHVANEELDGQCEPNERYYRMNTSDVWELIQHNPVIVSVSLVLLVLFLVVPLIDSKIQTSALSRSDSNLLRSNAQERKPFKPEEIDGEIWKLKDKIAEMERTIMPLQRGNAE